MNKKKKIFLAVWVVLTAALFYIFGPGQGPLEVETMKKPIIKSTEKRTQYCPHKQVLCYSVELAPLIK